MNDPQRDADAAFIEALAKLLRDQDLTEIELHRAYGEDDALSVRLSRGGPMPDVMAPRPVQPAATAQEQRPTPEQPAPEDVGALPPSDPVTHPGAVTSPMVGTAYLASEPGAEPFAVLGAQVEEGQTLLIVEAMKTMNQIPAPRAGIVRRILIEDGAPVEYGAPLMILE